MRLILCVDRDNDFGEKAGVETPIIGRRKNLSAAQKLIMTDPEDSDANTLFAAVREYDLLHSEGEAVAIATICGSSNIGRESDRKVREQLETVLARLKPSSVILFDDGAEDEAVAPIIESRVRIDRKVRVVVQQSERIESFYYMAKKILMEEKARKKVMIPLAIACILWSVAAFAGRPEVGTGAIVFLIGITMLIWAFRLENLVIRMGRDMRGAIRSGAISPYIHMSAFVILVMGVVYGYTRSDSISLIEHRMLEFIRTSLWFYIGSIWMIAVAKALDDYMRLDKKDYSLWPLSFALLSAGFLITGALGLVEIILNYTEGSMIMNVFLSILLAGIVALVGILGNDYIKAHVIPPASAEDWRL